MSCDCMEVFDKRLVVQNTKLSSILIIVKAEDGIFSKMEARPSIETQQIEKGRGKKKRVNVVATFCPFCGLRYAPICGEVPA